MKFAHLLLIVLTAVLVDGCASKQARTEAPELAPAAKVVPAKESPKESAKEIPKRESPQSVVIAKPVVNSRFSKLKIGMTLSQVERTIGPPTRQWTHPTNKVSIPFYFGPDRWVIQYSYKGEGVLTFNSGGEQLLTQIEVNKAE